MMCILNLTEILENYQDVIPSILPFFHIYGLTMLMMRGLNKGCKLVSLPKLDSQLFFDTLKNHKV